jgi:hypothetical protein
MMEAQGQAAVVATGTAAAPPPMVSPETYADYFSDATNDLYNGVPTAIYDDKTPGGNHPLDVNAIVKCIGSDPHMYTYIGFSQYGIAVRSFVFFQIHKVPNTRAAVRSRHEGEIIANIGDVTSWDQVVPSSRRRDFNPPKKRTWRRFQTFQQNSPPRGAMHLCCWGRMSRRTPRPRPS